MKKEAGPSGAEPRYAGHRMDHDGQNEKGDHLEREKGKDKDKDIVGSRDGSQRLARLSAAVVRGWRSSQGWIGWSLVGSVRSQERRGVKEVGGDGGICWKEPDLVSGMTRGVSVIRRGSGGHVVRQGVGVSTDVRTVEWDREGVSSD